MDPVVSAARRSAVDHLVFSLQPIKLDLQPSDLFVEPRLHRYLVCVRPAPARSRTSGENRLGRPIDPILLRNSWVHKFACFEVNEAQAESLCAVTEVAERPGAALLHESDVARNDPDPAVGHRLIAYDAGLPKSLI